MTKITQVLGVTGLLALAGTAHAACPRGTVEKGEINGKTLCAFGLKDYLGEKISLDNKYHYLLEQGTYFGGDNKDHSELHIEAGTTIYGNPATFLVIQRGSKIFADGSKNKPIVFTSPKAAGERKPGDWGGLVINGNAPINACASQPCEAISEGIKERNIMFGGGNPADSSGEIKYLRVEFGGYPISPNNELNGITFNGVGAGTKVDYVQIHNNADDGVEFFGGTVNIKHLVLTAIDDDSIDWDMGFQGKIQFAVIEQIGRETVDQNGIEADNLKSPMNAMPRSNPTLSNITLLGGAKSDFGIKLRRGTAGQLSNVIVANFGKACLNIDDAETFKNGASIDASGKVTATNLTLKHSLVSCQKPFQVDANEPWLVQSWFESQEGNQVADAKLNGWVPQAGSPALGAGVTPDDAFFEPVDYVGALSPDEDNWTAGWINNAAN